MAAQDVRELVPRVRRAIEGPVPLDSGAMSDDAVEALAADCVADIILLTEGQWGHMIAVSEVDPDTNLPLHYTVDPELSLPEQGMVAAQAAVQWFVTMMRDVKNSERIVNESREWEWSKSATTVKGILDELIAARDRALGTVADNNPPLARYASFLEVRDSLAAARIEPWTSGVGGRGGQYLLP